MGPSSENLNRRAACSSGLLSGLRQLPTFLSALFFPIRANKPSASIPRQSEEFVSAIKLFEENLQRGIAYLNQHPRPYHWTNAACVYRYS